MCCKSDIFSSLWVLRLCTFRTLELRKNEKMMSQKYFLSFPYQKKAMIFSFMKYALCFVCLFCRNLTVLFLSAVQYLQRIWLHVPCNMHTTGAVLYNKKLCSCLEPLLLHICVGASYCARRFFSCENVTYSLFPSVNFALFDFFFCLIPFFYIGNGRRTAETPRRARFVEEGGQGCTRQST